MSIAFFAKCVSLLPAYLTMHVQ